MKDQVRVTIYVNGHRGYAIEGIQREPDETAEKYAERVSKRLLELQANPSRM